ncbi:16025_t:CDS:10, partial [Acaulospora morrowiae]
THFWNAQESYFSYDGSQNSPPEITHDISFRTGVTQRGIETYTPRLMIYDLKGGFGSIKKMNKLYEEVTENDQDQLWDWKSEIHSQISYPKNEFLNSLEEEEERPFTSGSTDHMDIDFEERNFNLDQTVKTWSDFNRIYYHPKSINTISEFTLDDDLFRFDVFTYGKNAFLRNQSEEDSFEENFRFFAEECDAIQGFQILTDVTNGFGGFACGFLEQLREEYPKSAVLSFGITETQKLASPGQESYTKQMINSSLSTLQLTEMSSLFIPLNTSPSYGTMLKFIQPNFSLPYHSSSIISAAIETATLPFRSRRGFTHMSNLIDRLLWRGNTKIGTLGLTFPFPLGELGNLYYPSDNNAIDLSLPQNHEQNFSTTYGQSIVIRGIPDELRLSPKFSDVTSDIFQRFQFSESG